MKPRVLLAGSEHLDFIAELLRRKGYCAVRIKPRRRSSYLDVVPYFDVIYAEYLMNGARLAKVAKLLRKKSVMHVIGTDAVRYATEKFSWRWFAWLTGLALSDQILYASDNLQRLVGFRGITLPLPVDTRLFGAGESRGERRDVLYYCPANDPTYRPDWLVKFAESNPTLKITVVGDLGPRKVPRNVVVTPLVERRDMPRLYGEHKTLIRMTTHDGTPRMVFEALLSGLDVIWNGNKVTSVPEELTPEYFLEKLSEYALEMK
jgi:hypothetical protein